MPASDCPPIVVNCENGDTVKGSIGHPRFPHFSLSQENSHALRALQ
jgi:hypothetical protein